MTFKLEIFPPFYPEEITVYQNFVATMGALYPAATIAATGTTTVSGAVTSSATIDPPAVNYFPADPTQAPAPSPENSTILVLNGTIDGPPYLMDVSRTLYGLTLTGAATVDPKGGAVVTVGGIPHPAQQNYTELIVRQGGVYAFGTGGQVQVFNPSTGTMGYNATLPAAWPGGVAPTAAQAAATAAAAQAANLVPPVPSSVAPGSTGVTIDCGGTNTLSIAAGITSAPAGATVIVAPGYYNQALPEINEPIHLILTGATLDGAGLTGSLAGGGLGLVVPNADCIITDPHIINVALDQAASGDTSAIRPNAGCGYLTVNGTINISACQCAIGQGGFNCVVAIAGTGTISDCGLPDGQSHNVYVGSGGQGTLTISSDVAIINPRYAHAVKSRFPVFSMQGGTLSAANASPLDLPNGTSQIATLSGVLIQKGTADANHAVITYGEESPPSNGPPNGTAGMVVTGGTIAAACASPFIQVMGATITLSNVAQTGSLITAIGGGSVVGLAAA